MPNPIWVVPALLFAVVLVAIRVRPSLALMLFLVGPIIGMLLSNAAALFLLQLTGEINVLHLRDVLSFSLMFGLFDFMQMFYPHGTLLAAVVLIAFVWLRRFAILMPPSAGVRLATDALIGMVVGAAFAALVMLIVFLTQQNIEFVEFITGGTLDRLDFSVELMAGICTGLADGALIGIFGISGPGLGRVCDAVEPAAT